ncbi:MAG: two component heavy metal response transcriptional regulator, winged helix family [Myxococcaceae bacterium]|jgi:DNA-binding response OmpR family regulator|nr:two component heavy metal response transcriptional regulator, winged helix family [Myxococcaceae bacterium]
MRPSFPAPSPESDRITGEHATVPALRALVVEDDQDILDALAFALGGAFDVTPVASGVLALSLLDAQTFDLIVLDLYLPGVDGEAILQALRANAIRTPVVLASASRNVEATARTFGVAGFLRKPFSLTQLESMVATAVCPQSSLLFRRASAGEPT